MVSREHHHLHWLHDQHYGPNYGAHQQEQNPYQAVRPLYLYQEAFGFFRMGYASALAWVLLALVAIFTAFSFLTSKYWVHYDD